MQPLMRAVGLSDGPKDLKNCIEGAKDGSERFERVLGSKALDANIDKSVYLLAAKRKNLKKIRHELEKNPLIFKGQRVKEKMTEKWLGSTINTTGQKGSSISTINERKHRILTIINETRPEVSEADPQRTKI